MKDPTEDELLKRLAITVKERSKESLKFVEVLETRLDYYKLKTTDNIGQWVSRNFLFRFLRKHGLFRRSVGETRGFASMSISKRRALASLGGKQSHASGNAYEWTPEAAAEAGRKGVEAKAKKYGRKVNHSMPTRN